jgi:hypothetical protein
MRLRKLSCRSLALAGLVAVAVGIPGSTPTSGFVPMSHGRGLTNPLIGSRIIHSAGPVVVCGQTLYSEPEGALLDTFTRPGHYELSGGLGLSPRPPRVLDFVTSCHAGVTITLKPRGSLRIYSEARTEDHQIAAIAVTGHRPGVVRVIATRPEGNRTVVAVHILGDRGKEHP